MSLARLTLDTTTVAAYALGSEDVGEVPHLLGSLGRACAALLFARGHVDYVLTTEPDAYGEGIETIPIGE